MRYLSVCSGIEAATVAWHHLGWTPVAFSEIEPFPSAVLAHHYPNVPNYGDMTKFEEWPLEPETVDLLVGGTPCQSFSIAGLRKGISDPRGGLMLTYLEIARRFRPRWIVWENVPGVLSSGGGRDFGSLLGGLEELGYGWAYRVLDAQYCRVDGRWPKAVPQRRRRVFVVGCDLERDHRGRELAAEVLALGTGLRWHLAESGKTRKGTTADAEAGARAGCVTSHDVAPCLETTCHDYSRADGFTMVGQPSWPAEVAPTLNQSARGTGAPGYSDQEIFSQGAGNLVPQPVPYDLFQITAPVNRQNRKPGDPCHTLARDNEAHAAVAIAFKPGQSAEARTIGAQVGVACTLEAGGGGNNKQAVAFNWQNGGGYGNANEGLGITIEGTGPIQRCNTPALAHAVDVYNQTIDGDCAATLTEACGGTNTSGPKVMAQAMTVRRLTPRECERLQGFPDDYTAIPWRKKPADECPDGPRYKALGNSMAVNCMAWIGERIHALNCEHDQ